MLSVNNSTAAPLPGTLAKEIIVEEKLDLAADLKQDQQVKAIKELDAIAALRDFDKRQEMQAIDRLNTGFKEFQIRRNILQDHLEQRQLKIAYLTNEIQNEDVRKLEEIA